LQQLILISKIKEVLEILEDRIIEIKISEGKGIVCYKTRKPNGHFNRPF